MEDGIKCHSDVAETLSKFSKLTNLVFLPLYTEFILDFNKL